MTARIVHRQDERGVIVESTIVLDGQEVPEGFSESTGYTKVADSRLPQGEPVQIEDSKIKAGEVETPATIDETIEQEFVPEAAGEIAESDQGESLEEAATAAADSEDDESDSGKSTSRRKASRSS